MGAYLRVGSIEEAVGRLSERPWTVVGGCTDYYCRRDASPLDDDVLDITGITTARGIVEEPGQFRIGALTTWTDLAQAALPPQFEALREAARQVGGVQIQNAGTIGGNLCNASPAADGVPPLLILDAQVELQSAAGSRLLPLPAFILGSRRTALRADELLTAVLVPKRSVRPASMFLKLGARAYQVISIVMVAALLEPDSAGDIAGAAVVVGACSAVAQRLSALEETLQGRPLAGRPLSQLLREEHLSPLSPLTDVRGTAEYRRDAARSLIGRALDRLQERLA